MIHTHTHTEAHRESVTQPRCALLRNHFGVVVGLVAAAAVAVVLGEISI